MCWQLFAYSPQSTRPVGISSKSSEPSRPVTFEVKKWLRQARERKIIILRWSEYRSMQNLISWSMKSGKKTFCRLSHWYRCRIDQHRCKNSFFCVFLKYKKTISPKNVNKDCSYGSAEKVILRVEVMLKMVITRRRDAENGYYASRWCWKWPLRVGMMLKMITYRHQLFWRACLLGRKTKGKLSTKQGELPSKKGWRILYFFHSEFTSFGITSR